MSNIVKISELTDEEKEKWKKHVQETLPTVRNVKDSSAVELQSSDTPIVSKADPRLRMARKRLTEYTAEDYNTASKLASINQRKYSNIINNMADKNPVGAFLLNAEMNLASGMNQSVMGVNNAINTIGASATKGIENIAKFTNNTDLENRARDTYNKRIAEGNYLDIASKFISGGNQGINNGVIRTGGNVASTIGNQLMSAGLGGSTGLSGSTTQAIGVAGSSAQEVLNENKDNIVQALITGGTKGYLSKKIEDVFDANILTSGTKKTSIQKQVNNWIANSFKSNTGKLIAQNVSGVLGENAEEFLEDNLGNIIDKFVNNKDLPSFEEWWNNTTETAKTTTLTTIVMQLLGFGGGDVDTEVDSDVDFWTKEAQKIVNDKSIQNNTQNIQQNQVNSQRNLQEQQITQIENNVAQNQNMEQIDTENVKPQLDNILNNKELPMQSYIYEKSTNEKINTLREDASKYFNNSEKAHNYMKMLEKIIEDKDINIRLDANLKTADGRVANGSYSNGSITINPNSTRTGEFIAVHELTHAIGTKEMLNMVENYRKNNVEFDNSVKELLNNYNSTEITEEALSDISAQLFGIQEFINNVAESNPNIFKKIYNEIKYLWHQFKGYKNQDQFVNDLYYKWTQVYNDSNTLNSGESYSIAGEKGMKNIVKSDPYNGIMIEQMYNKAQQLQKNGMNNEDIRQQTGWFQDKNGDWKFEFTDRDMSIKSNLQLKENTTYKLGDILEHDTLFTAYPELADYIVVIKDSKVNGSFNKSNKTITLSTEISKKRKSIEGTLIHEVQHAIQNIEGFEHGASSKNSKLRYYNSLGEIEATDTKSRFIQEKYNNKDVSNIAPESSKSNPQHKSLQNYLKNRNMLDKVKDSIYNYFNKEGGKNNYEEIIEQNYAKNENEKNKKVEEEDFNKEYGIKDNYEKNRDTLNEDDNNTKHSIQESENNSKTEIENDDDIMLHEKKELIKFTKKQEEELAYWISQKRKLEKVKETLKYEDLRKFNEHWASEYKNNIDGFIKDYYEEFRDRIQKNLENNEKFIKGAKNLIDIAKKENLVISKSPYGDSYYAHKSNEGIGWGIKPEGSYRLSNHWNWGGRRTLRH